MKNPLKRRPSWDGLGEKALTGTPGVLDGIRGGASPYPLLGGGSRQRITDAFNMAQSANYAWIYANSPAVRTVVDIIVRNVGQLDLRLYEEISEAERQPRPEHPAALSMRYPSEQVSRDSFIRSMFKDFLLFDNAYALLEPAQGGQISFHRLPAHMVEVRGSSLFSVDGYRYWRADGSYVDFAPESVLHWHGENPSDPRVGLSRLDTLRSVIAEDAALQQATVELANSGLTEPVWAFRPLEAPLMSNDAEKGLAEDLTNRIHSRNRRVIVTQEGTELRSFGVSPRDAQMMEVRRWAIERVASVYGVPPGVLGLERVSVAQFQSQFYADTLPPYCEDFTMMLNQRILVRVYDWTAGCFEFNLDEKLMGDERLKTLVSASGGPVLLRNEARAMVNRPPIPGGDEIITPLNVIVGDKPKPSVDVMPVQDPNGPEQDGSYREDRALPAVKAAEPVPQLVPSRKADLDRQHRNIDLAQAAVERHYARLTKKLRAKAGQADWSRWDREFADDLNRLLGQIVETEGTLYAFKLGGEFDMARVVNYLRAMAEGTAEAINATIRQEITDLGLDDALARRGQHVASAGAGLGAAATRWSREEAARQAPGTEHRVKVWIADTARHEEFAGDTVPLGADWPAGFAPGSAPGCRCTQAIQ